MNEPTKIAVLTEAELESVIKRAVAEALKTQNGQGIVNIGSKEWLRAGEAAQLYGLPKTWFEERGRAGDIVRTKPGRYVLFNRRDIEAYMQKHKEKNGGEA